jgi:GTP cyclohydrolase IA
MIDTKKTDPTLGEAVRKVLIAKGIETPSVQNYWRNLAQDFSEGKENVRQELEASFLHIMQLMGLDMTDDSLEETPKRLSKMWLFEIFAGLDWANFPKITLVQNKMLCDEMVIERNIRVHSTCEHHLLAILGVAHVAYIPDKKVPGLSKLNRVVEFFSRRPQIQERLTAQIHATLCHVLDTENVAIIIEAEHLCVKTRGVEDPCSDTVTSKLSGVFKSDPKVRAEFIALTRKAG